MESVSKSIKAELKRADKGLLRRLALRNERTNSSAVLRILIALFVLVPTGEFKSDFTMRSKDCEGYCGCWAFFRMCLYNPLTWLFVVVMFFYCIVSCGLAEFFREFKGDVFGEHTIYIKKKGLAQILG